MGRTLAGLSDRVLWWTAFVALGLVGGAFALGIPIGGQPDEPAHLIKASALYRGELTWNERGPLVVGTGPDDLTRTELEVDAPVGYADLGLVATCIAKLPRQDATCSPPVNNDTTLTRTSFNTYVIAYPPVPYLLMGWPTVLFEPSKAIFAVRLSNVAVCAALVASALVAARERAGRGWPALGVALATTPTAVLFFTSPNPNGPEIAASIGVAASLLALLGGEGRPSTRGVVRFAVAASLLVLCRPVSFTVLGFVVAMALAGAATRARLRELSATTSVRGGLVAVAMATIAALAWFVYARPLEVLVGIPVPGLERGDAIEESVSRLPVRVKEMVGVFGWGEVPAPPWMWWGWLAAVAGVVLAGLVLGRWRHRAVLVGLVVANAALPTIMEVPRAAELGYIWQGRYSLPFAVTVPIFAAWVVGRSGRMPVVATRIAAVGVGGFAAVALVAAHGISVTRFATGGIEPWWGYLDDPTWEPKVAPVALLVAVVGGAATWACSVVTAALVPTPPPEPSPSAPPESATQALQGATGPP